MVSSEHKLLFERVVRECENYGVEVCQEFFKTDRKKLYAAANKEENQIVLRVPPPHTEPIDYPLLTAALIHEFGHILENKYLHHFYHDGLMLLLEIRAWELGTKYFLSKNIFPDRKIFCNLMRDSLISYKNYCGTEALFYDELAQIIKFLQSE